MSSSKRIIALCLTAVFLLTLAVAAAVTVAEAYHDCTGIDCPVCRLFTAVSSIIKSAAAALSVIFIYIDIRRIGIAENAAHACCFITDTPISYKVKLLN